MRKKESVWQLASDKGSIRVDASEVSWCFSHLGVAGGVSFDDALCKATCRHGGIKKNKAKQRVPKTCILSFGLAAASERLMAVQKSEVHFLWLRFELMLLKK